MAKTEKRQANRGNFTSRKQIFPPFHFPTLKKRLLRDRVDQIAMPESLVSMPGGLVNEHDGLVSMPGGLVNRHDRLVSMYVRVHIVLGH